MTGTGSTVFGIFKSTDEINLSIEGKHFYKWMSL
jgi:4-diphosphocytidyl-2C-methyl-D-erythritol kinase